MEPKVVVSNPIPEQPKSSINWGKLIFIILGAVIVGELVYAGLTLLKPLPQRAAPTALEQPAGGKIILLAPTKEYRAGETLLVSIGVTTGSSSTDGTDVVLRYNPQVLEASAGAFQRGSLYSEYRPVTIDPKLGLIQISAISPAGQPPISGIGEFGKVVFKVKQAGKASVSVDFQPGSTSDSNIIESKTVRDVLEEVSNVEFIVK